MARRKEEPVMYRVYLNGELRYSGPFEGLRGALTSEEKRALVDRMGEVINNRFAADPAMYLRVCKSVDTAPAV